MPVTVPFVILLVGLLLPGGLYFIQGWPEGSVYFVGALVLSQVVLLCFFIANYWQRRRQAGAKPQERNKPSGSSVTARTEELSALARHLLTSREKERLRIVRELHDELGSNLAAITLDISWVNLKIKD